MKIITLLYSHIAGQVGKEKKKAGEGGSRLNWKVATLNSPGGNAATRRAARVAGQPPNGPTQRALHPGPTPLTGPGGPPDDWPLGRAGGRAGRQAGRLVGWQTSEMPLFLLSDPRILLPPRAPPLDDP